MMKILHRSWRLANIFLAPFAWHLIFFIFITSGRARSEHGKPSAGILKLAVLLLMSSVNLWTNGLYPAE